MGWDGMEGATLCWSQGGDRHPPAPEPCWLMGRLLRATHGHLRLKIVISILIHFTFGSSLLNSEAHRALGTPKA